MITNLNELIAVKALIDKVDPWVSECLKGYTPKQIFSNKIVKDPVWGMTILTPLEVSILDSPLLQRLRRIYQTGLVNLTYPAALHTRFEHSIGMLHCATSIIDSINRNEKSQKKNPRFTEKDEQEIRLACLLHDVGHSTLSHLTEDLYSGYTEIEQAKQSLEASEPSVKPKNHELLSAVIVMTPSFLSIFEKAVEKNRNNLIDFANISANRIADMIIGRPVEGKLEQAFITDIINGSYDADRLDYIFRDSYFTGLALGTDVEKFISGLSIEKVESTGKTSIVLAFNSMSSYDRLISSKVSLSSDVYNHQKVLATNVLVKNILYILNTDLNNTIQGISLKNPIDFLSLTDWSFLTGTTKSTDIRNLQEMIARRDIPVRYVKIFHQSINSNNEEGEIPPSIAPYFSGGDKERNDLIRLLCKNCGFDFFKPKSIFMEFPEFPSLGELQNAYIKNYDGTSVLYNSIMPTNQYNNDFGYKWAVYVFGHYEKLEKDIYEKVISCLQHILNIELNDNARPRKLWIKRT